MTDEGFDSNDVNWEDFIDDLGGMVNTTTEAVIAEIVDNSLDNQGMRIQIEFYGTNWNDFAIIVYDDGRGFRNHTHMKECFDLSGHKSQSGRIGKFNVGLKLSPLSRCEVVLAHSFGESGEKLFRSLDKTIMKTAGTYGSTTTKQAKHATLNRYIAERLEEENWKTAVALTTFEIRPEIEDDFTEQSKKKYGDHIAKYLGVIYHDRILESRESGTNIKIESHGISVIPMDPFWSDLTPARIRERLSLQPPHPDSFQESDRYRMECLIPWGTVSTVEDYFFVNWEGEKHKVLVQGFSIPHKQIRGRFPKRYTKGVFTSGPSGMNTPRLRGPNISGLYFYRESRCVCFGDTGPDSNLGWYSLMKNVQTYLNITRIKITFPVGLDDYLKLSPNKDRVTPRGDFMDKVEKSLRQLVHIQDLRGSLGEPLNFFVKNTDRECQTNPSSASWNSKLGGRWIQKECPHCEEWHFKEDECPRKPATPPSPPGPDPPPSPPEPGPPPSPPEPGPPEERPSELIIVDSDWVWLKLRRGDENNESLIEQAKQHIDE